MTRFATVVIIASLMVLVSCDYSQKAEKIGEVTSPTQKTMITLQQIEEMFTNMRGEYGWDVDGALVWGYIFTDHNRAKLEAAIPALEKIGYRFVGILEPSAQDDDKKLLFLHVEKVEQQTPQTLNARNLELYRLAKELGLESYDGMDAGPVKNQ